MTAVVLAFACTKDYPSALKMFLRMKRQLEDNKLQDHFDM